MKKMKKEMENIDPYLLVSHALDNSGYHPGDQLNKTAPINLKSGNKSQVLH